MSTGLLGWLDTLKTGHAEGVDIATLAARYRLPADYFRATLDEPWDLAADASTAEENEA